MWPTPLHKGQALGRAGVQVLYRTCNGRTDFCGGQNRYTYLKDLAKPDRYDWFVAELKRLAAATPPGN